MTKFTPNLPLSAYGTPPKGALLLTRTAAAGLRPAPSGERHHDFNKFFRDYGIKTIQLIKKKNEDALAEHQKIAPNTLYISPTTKGCDQPSEAHLGADRLLQRKPMICIYGGISFTLFHKDLVDALLAEDIRPAKGGYEPIILKTENGNFENTDYFRVSIGAIGKPEFWCSGFQYNVLAMSSLRVGLHLSL